MFIDDMMLYMEKPKRSIKKAIGLINQFNKITGYKTNIQKWFLFAC